MRPKADFTPEVSEASLRREKAKGRELRASQWWKRRIETGRCYYCGRSVGAKKLTMDHVVPLIRGGRSTRGNVVPACKECNNAKTHLLPVEWGAYLRHLGRSADE